MLPGVLGPALAAWAGAAASLLLGWRVGAGLAALGAAVAVGLAVLAPPRLMRTRGVGMALAALVLFTCFTAAAAVREHEVRSDPLARLAGSGERIDLVVRVWTTDDPRPVRGNRVLIPAEVRAAWVGSAQTGGELLSTSGSVSVLAPAAGYGQLSPWQEVVFQAKIAEPKRHDLTVAALSALGPPKEAGPVSWVARATGALRKRFAIACDRVLSEDESRVLPGVALGDVAGLTGQLKEQFEDAGLTHLMVVSGANFAVVLGALLLVLRGLGLGPRLCALCAFVGLVGMVLLVRPSPSVLRAAVMGSLALVALFSGRRRQALHALGVTLVVLLAAAPALAVDYGFVLSVLATWALLAIAPPWRDRLKSKGVPTGLAEVLAVSSAAHLVTFPVVAMLFGKVSLVGVVANLAVEPVMGLMTVLGSVGVLATTIWEPLGELVIRFAGVPAAWLVSVAKAASACPYGVVHTGAGFPGFIVTAVPVLTLVGVLWLFKRHARQREGPAHDGSKPPGIGVAQGAGPRRASRGRAVPTGDRARRLWRHNTADGAGSRRGHDP